MSVIDNRVVQMDFDNSSFEKNVSTSLSTLDKLKKALNFSGLSDGFRTISSAAAKVSVEPLAAGVETVTSKFSVLEAVAFSALQRITNKAMDTGERLIKSLSIEQVSSGWSKYASQIESTQTILSAVGEKINARSISQETVDTFVEYAKSIKDSVDPTEALAEAGYSGKEALTLFKKAIKGTSIELGNLTEEELKALGATKYDLETVDDLIAKLSWYSDETSYSTTQMVDALGSFTSGGQDFYQSVDAIMGIANACALAGVNTSKASYAFDAFSKAIGSGQMNLAVWNNQLKTSGLTNNEKFKQTIIEAAVACGTLKDAGDGMYKTAVAGTKSLEVSIADFTGALTSTGWLNSEVMLTALKTYAEGLNDVYDQYNELSAQGVTTSDILDDLTKSFEAQGKEIPLWLKSFKMGQEAKTFSDAIESVKDAVSSTWADTFKIIFGNYEEAKVLWTDLANDLYDIFANPRWATNELLEEALGDMGGRDVLLEVYANSMEALKEVIEAVSNAWHNVFPPATAERVYAMVEAVRDFTEKLIIFDEEGEFVNERTKNLFGSLQNIFAVLKNIADGFKVLLSTAKDVWEEAFPAETIDGIAETLYSITGKLNFLSKGLVLFDGKAKDTADVLPPLIKDFSEAYTEALKASKPLPPLTKGLKGLSTQLHTMEGDSTSDIFGVMADSAEDATEKIYPLAKGVSQFSDKMESLDGELGPASVLLTALSSAAAGTLSVFKKVGELGLVLGGVLKNVATNAKTLFTYLVPGSEVISSISQFFDYILAGTEKVIDHAKAIREATNSYEFAAAVLDKSNEKVNKLINIFTTLKSWVTTTIDIFKNVATIIVNVVKDIKLLWNYIIPNNSEISLLNDALSVISFVLEAIRGLTNAIVDFTDPVKLSTKLSSDQTSAFKFLKTAVEKLTAAYGFLRNIVVEVKDSTVNFFKSICATKDVDASEKRISRLSKIFDFFGMVLSKITSAIEKLSPVFQAIGKVISSVIDSLATGITHMLETGDYSLLFDTLNAGLLGGLFVSVKAIPEILETLTDSLDAMQTKVQTAVIKDIAISVLLLAASAAVMASVDSKRLTASVIAIGILMAEMTFVVKNMANTFSTFGDGTKQLSTKLKAMKQVTKIITAMGVSLLFMALAMKVLSTIEFGPLLTALGGLTYMMGLLTVVALVLSKYSSKIAIGASSILAFAGAMLILSVAMKLLATMSLGEILKSLVALAGGMVILAVGLLALRTALPGAAALAIASVSLVIFAGAMLLLSKVSDIGKTLITLAGGLGVLALALFAMNMGIPGALALIVASSALLIFAGAMAILCNLPKMGRVIGAIAALLGILSIGLTLMIIALPGAYALLIFAKAMLVLVPALLLLGEVSKGVVGKALLRLTGIIAALVGLSLLLTPATFVLMAFAIALAAVSAGFIVLAAAMTALSVAMTVITAFGTTGVKMFTGVLYALLDSLILLVPKFVELVKVLLIDILNMLIETMPTFFTFVVELVIGLCATLKETLPVIIETVVYVLMEMWTRILKVFAEKIPDLIDAGWKALIAFINGFAEAIEANAADLRDAVFKLCKSILGAFLTFFGINTDKPVMETQGTELIKNILKGLKDKAAELWEDFKDIGKYIIEGLKNGIEAAKDSLLNTAKNVWTGVKDGAQKLFGIHSPSKVFAEYGMYIDQGLAKGIGGYASIVNDATTDMGEDVISIMSDTIMSLNEAIEEGVDSNPTIRPVLDLSDIQNRGSAIGGMLSTGISINARNANLARLDVDGNGATSGSGTSYNFYQYNTSPKALSTIDIYRRTKSQFAQMKGLVNGV